MSCVSCDISYMVADLKYSQEHGIKICEVQHGTLSALKGNDNIPLEIANFFDRILYKTNIKKWIAGLMYQQLRNILADKGWCIQRSIKTLIQDPEFKKCAAITPTDPTCIASYSGIVYATCDIAQDKNFDRSAYPGILFIDLITLPYWIDKYKMNALFDDNDELSRWKAEWCLWEKKYDMSLADKIRAKLPTDEFYVIKPRREFLANGVIVIASKDLDNTLHTILNPDANLRYHSDKKYSYWARNNDDTFIIERYYASDSVTTLGDYLNSYDATMRIAFILIYDAGVTSCHCLGGFWKLPCKGLEEDGSVNEKRISFCAHPFYRMVDPALLAKVNVQMERAMLLLYKVMLSKQINK